MLLCNRHREERNVEGESRIFCLETLCHKILQLYQLIPPEHSTKLIKLITQLLSQTGQVDVDHRLLGKPSVVKVLHN